MTKDKLEEIYKIFEQMFVNPEHRNIKIEKLTKENLMKFFKTIENIYKFK